MTQEQFRQIVALLDAAPVEDPIVFDLLGPYECEPEPLEARSMWDVPEVRR